MATYGRPEIFNTDQGCQFTSEAFTSVLQAHDIRISMDGKGRWIDNVFVERLWRSLKYEEVYLRAYDTIAQALIVPLNPSMFGCGSLSISGHLSSECRGRLFAQGAVRPDVVVVVSPGIDG